MATWNKIRGVPLCLEQLEQRRLLSANSAGPSELSVPFIDHDHEWAYEDVSPAQAYPSREIIGPLPVGHDRIAIQQVADAADVPLPLLSSNADSPNKIYLDFDGHVVTDTTWNASFFDGDPIHAIGYSIDDDVNSYNEAEIDAIHEIWQRFAEDYVPVSYTHLLSPLHISDPMRQLQIAHPK